MPGPTIAVILGTIRQGRFAEKPAQWILEQATALGGANFETVDLRDYPLPLFDEAIPPARGTPKNEMAQRWGRKIAEYDGYIFITAEYNHGISGALKNALDWLHAEMYRKPAAFIGYGNTGGARAVEQLRLIAIEYHLAPLREAVHIGLLEFRAMLREGKSFGDFPHLGQTAGKMLADLLWWTNVLKTGRSISS
jgi:NAD(P)H-dependent FMN reductase